MRSALLLVAPILLASAGSLRAGEEAPGAGGPVTENRLAGERSPYLKQHRTNPVDWYPWGEEAFGRARRENRPVFLSVGYAACHWCHVMEHESFEDEETATLLNDVFVCVKVDREERPDVDALYMSAVHVMSGRGGWPMTVLLTPEGDPFYAATYLPRAKLQDLARQVHLAWVGNAEGIRTQAELVSERIAELAGGQELPAFEGGDADLLHILDTAMAAQLDRRRGGYGGAPKFPPHAELLYLLDRGDAVEEGGEQLRVTLDAMVAGGVHDQVGGGFHRYSTDGDWLLPHFEKMLYDNALLAQAYARAHASTGDDAYARVARGTLDWVVREMARPAGGYASSLDADTEGEEGLTYTWTTRELRAALAPEDVALAIRAWGVEETGNFREESTGRLTGRNVLHRAAPLGAEAERLDRIRRALLAVRDERPQPGLDDKVITAWNGLLLSAFAHAGTALGDEAWLAKGRELATYLLTAYRRDDGTLLRFPRASGPEIVGFCDDHAHLADGLLDLADATGEARWAEAARDLGDRLLEGFEDADAGGFFATSAVWHEKLLARSKHTFDDPIPSDNGTAVRVMLRLGERFDDERYRKAADRALGAWRPLLGWARAARGVVELHRGLALRDALRGAAAGGAAAGDVVVTADLVRVDAFLERAAARPGEAVRFALHVALDAGWHVNGARPPDADRVPTTLALPDGAPAVLEAWTLPEGDVLEGTWWVRGRLRVPAEAPAGPRRIRLVLAFQPCDASSCQAPRELFVDLPLRFDPEAEADRRHPAVFAD